MSIHEKQGAGGHAQEKGEETYYTKVVVGSEALAQAIAHEPPRPMSKRSIQLYAICGLIFLANTMNGYDGSLMGSILVMPAYQKQFGVGIVGAKAGLISGMGQIGSVAGLLFAGPCADTWGRRYGMFLGCLIIVVGTILEGTSRQVPQFLGGRFVLGFGGTLVTAGAPAYIVEISHPKYRAVITGLYSCCYYLGYVIAAAAVRGCVHYTTNQSWLIPTWVQMACPGILMVGVLFLPESPRWLYSHGKTEAAAAILTKFHGEDNPNSMFVALQLHEFGQEIELNGADKRWWDYRALFNTPAARYRAIYCSFLLSMFSQWAGNGIVSYYLPALLATAGITDADTVLDINIGIAVVSGIASVTGASVVERTGRRKLLISVCITLSAIWAIITAGTAVYSNTGNVATAKMSVAFVFIFGIVFSLGYTPLQQLYVTEVLAFEQRAKGLAFQLFGGNLAGLLNQFAMPVALGNIGWYTYIVFIFVCLLEALFYYLIMVETKGRTLEELNEIFAARNPRNASLAKKEIVVVAPERKHVD